MLAASAHFDVSTAPWYLTPSVGDVDGSLASFMRLPRLTRHHLVSQTVSKEDATVLSRIGSQSFAAAAYDVQLGGEAGERPHIVAKMMPNYSSSDQENRCEVIRASMLSELVLQGISPYFPIVYGGRMTVKTMLPLKLPACQTINGEADTDDRDVGLIGRHAASRHEIISTLLDSDIISEAGKEELRQRAVNILRWTVTNRVEVPYMFDFLYPFATSCAAVDDIVKRVIEETISFDSTVLFSEMAQTDLKTLLQVDPAALPAHISDAARRLRGDPTVFRKLCSQIFSALKAMQEYAGMVHDDLHMGNVLVTFDDSGELMPMIHDFGSSRVRAQPPAPGAATLFPCTQQLSEVIHGTVARDFTTEARVADLKMLFVNMLLPFAEKASSGVHPGIVAFLQEVKIRVMEYTRRNRIDGGLLDELMELT